MIQQTIRDSIREILREERLALCLALASRVSKREMEEIRSQCGNPDQYASEEFVNMTSWVRHGTDLE